MSLLYKTLGASPAVSLPQKVQHLTTVIISDIVLLDVIRQNPSRVETIDIPQPNTRHSPVMVLTILRLVSLIPIALRLRSDLALENLALRQQLTILKRQLRRPRLRRSDRCFWLLLSRSWRSWKESLLIGNGVRSGKFSFLFLTRCSNVPNRN